MVASDGFFKCSKFFHYLRLPVLGFNYIFQFRKIFQSSTNVKYEGFKKMSDMYSSKSSGNLVVEEVRPKIKKPPLYKVILTNDDYTPMNFVVEILEYFFSMTEEQATQVMLQVHTQGKGICGVFTREIAETKVDQVNTFSRMNDHPLLCTMEIE
jgi:ATP-dependent Clp protease adaptor protein ClpS